MKQIMDVALAIEETSNLDDLSRIAESFLNNRDCDTFGLSYLRHDDMGTSEFVPLTNMPEDFLVRYAEQDYFLLDPLAQYCLKTTTPFVWQEVLALNEQAPVVRQIYSEAAEFGMPNGITIPVRSREGLHGSVTFAGERADFGHRERMELNVLAMVMHSRVADLCNLALSRAVGPRLSQREQETLKWGALGKTSGEIAAILGLTKRTIDQHFENASRKLGTVNRVHTVVQAVRHNLISL